MLLDILISLAGLGSDAYYLWPDGTLEAWSWLGGVAGCGEYADFDTREMCVTATGNIADW